jgi:hypothetical protein
MEFWAVYGYFAFFVGSLRVFTGTEGVKARVFTGILDKFEIIKACYCKLNYTETTHF